MFETSEEMGQWKEMFEEAIAEGLGDDAVGFFSCSHCIVLCACLSVYHYLHST